MGVHQALLIVKVIGAAAHTASEHRCRRHDRGETREEGRHREMRTAVDRRSHPLQCSGRLRRP